MGQTGSFQYPITQNDEELKSWVESNNIDRESRLIPKNISLEFSDFPVFIR